MQALTVSNNFPKIFTYGDAYLGLTGLATDVTTMYRTSGVTPPPRTIPLTQL
jgi:20S proteasome alpha/beta subunit